MPVQETAIVDKLLTNVSQAIMPVGLIADDVLTPLTSDQTTGKIGKYGNGHLRIQANTKIVGKGKYPRIDLVTRDSDVYDIEENGLSDVVTAKDYLNVEDPFSAESDTTTMLTVSMRLGREKALADTLTNTSNLTNNVTLAGNDQYNNLSHSDSDPLGDANTANGTILDAIGMEANTLIIPVKVARALRYHDKLLDKLGFKENRPGGLTDEELARAFSVDRVLIPRAVYNNAEEGQTDDIQPVWGKDMIFAYIDPAAQKYSKTLGFSMRLRSKGNVSVFKAALNNPPGATEILVSNWYDDLIADANCAYLIKDAIA